MKFVTRIIVMLLGMLLSTGLMAFGTAPDSSEREEISRRLEDFYRWPPQPQAMDMAIRKYDAVSGEPTNPNEMLRLPTRPHVDPLLRQAQAKAKPSFQRDRCERFLKQKFPELKCGEPNGLETAAAHDKVESLAQTWLSEGEIDYGLGRLPVKGTIKTPYWSGDYWAMRDGLTSFRYGTGDHYSDYRAAAAAYEQPKQWRALLEAFDPEKIAAAILMWSPAEKYDVMTGAETFPLANEQKREGADYADESGEVESWFGICHGWAPASVFVAPPVRPVIATGARGVKVAWHPDDIEALVTLAWANGSFSSNFVGGRCNAKDIERYENGRVKQPECFDNNPSTFHHALGNLIGKKGVPFIMDASFDHQVWNQPVLGYEFEYFNPLDQSVRSARWDEVAIPYDAAFKAKDRFQKPLTRGRRLSEGSYDDAGVRKIVGVIATVTYLVEISADPSDTAHESRVTRITYLYDLELHDRGGELVALGGEWHSNAHPDFLWVPKKGSVPFNAHDAGVPAVSLDRVPSETLTAHARRASAQGYPLCEVLKPLVEASSGGKYLCR